jgi:hypothetical protein
MLTVLSAVGADISVTAELPRPEVNSGEMSELQIRVSGAQQADVPQQIAVDGLQVRLTGQSTQVQMVNFKVTSSAVYSYIIMPLRTGAFTIPGVTVTADGRQFRTAPLQFSVADTRAASVPPPAQQPLAAQPPPAGYPGLQQPVRRPRPAPPRPTDLSRVAFGEINCPRKTLYAGEVVPVEIRYYFDAQYQVQVRGKLDFGAEGVVIERFGEPKESREERDGTIYNVLTFRTVLSAIKPGPIDIPEAKLESQVQIPGAVPPGFDDPVFRQLLGGNTPFAEPKDLTVKSAPLHLDIVPLPKEGRPDSFTGAIGQFDIDAIVQNPKPAAGDPVSLSVKIGGKGNFKGMGAPVLTQEEGWRSYPPTDRFEGTDDSYSGVKSFEYTLIALERKSSSPGVEFSYFDPVAAKYVTLSSKPLPLTAMPGATNQPVGATTDAVKNPPAGAKSPSSASAVVKEGDPYPTITLRSWQCPVRRSEFVIASLAMLIVAVALASVLGYRHIQMHGGTARARRRRQIADLAAVIRDGRGDEAAVLEAALEYAELALPDSEKRQALVESLRSRHDQLKYGLGGSRPMDDAERRRLAADLAELSGKSSL